MKTSLYIYYRPIYGVVFKVFITCTCPSQNTEDGTTTIVQTHADENNLAGTTVKLEQVDTNDTNVDKRNRDAECDDEHSRETTPLVEDHEFTEFEFSPNNDSSFRRDRSSSLEPEDVLDQLYEAASKGDSNKLCNLMFIGNSMNADSDKPVIDTEDLIKSTNRFDVSTISQVNQNKAIINLLKRKTPIEKEQIAELESAKKAKMAQEKIVNFTNVKNVRNIGSLGLGNLTSSSKSSPFEIPIKRKNPLRTPTPPLNIPTRRVVKPKITVQSVLDIVNPPNKLPEAPAVPSVEKNLIDYSVLTKALTKTLEDKLQEGENNDVKIVIFCNNKPIQSFSVRSNSKQSLPTQPSPEPRLPVCTIRSMLNSNTPNLMTSPPTPPTNVNEILSQNPLFISKQVNHSAPLSSPRTIPTIGDVKAILERNRRIANESLAKFSKNRTKTKRIPDEQLALILKELKSKGSDSDSDNNSQAVEASKSHPNRPARYVDPSTHKDMHRDQEDRNDDDDDLEERNLVINDAVATDELVNLNIEDVQCDQCNRTFKQQRYLNRHKIRVHSSSKQRYPYTRPQEHAPNNNSSIASQEPSTSKNIDELLQISSEKHVGNSNYLGSPSDENRTGVVGVKLDGTDMDTDKKPPIEEVDITNVKSEPVSDSEDQEIQSVLANDKLLNLLETADKNKRSLFNQENQPQGVLAKDLLQPSYKAKAYSFDYRPPMTEEGLVEPVYVCEQCGKFYRARKTLKDHFLREHAKDKDDEPLYLYITGNKYQCPICFNNYHSGSELVSHTKKHTGELRSVCKLCGKVYSSVHVLRRHIDNIHSDVKPRPFQCELCDYAASNKWHLKEHYRRHTGILFASKCPSYQLTSFSRV